MADVVARASKAPRANQTLQYDWTEGHGNLNSDWTPAPSQSLTGKLSWIFQGVLFLVGVLASSPITAAYSMRVALFAAPQSSRRAVVSRSLAKSKFKLVDLKALHQLSTKNSRRNCVDKAQPQAACLYLWTPPELMPIPWNEVHQLSNCNPGPKQ